MLKSVFHDFFLCKKNIAVFALVLLFCLYEIVGLCKDGAVFVRCKLAEKGVVNLENELLNNDDVYTEAIEGFNSNIEELRAEIKDLNNEKKTNSNLVAKLDEEVTELNQYIKASQKLKNVFEKNKENLEKSKKLKYHSSTRDDYTSEISKLDDDISALNEGIHAKDNEIKDKIKIQEDKNRRNNEIEKIIQVFNVDIENIKNDIAECEIKKYRKEFEERLEASKCLPFIVVLFLAIFLIVLFIIRCVYLEDLKKLNQEINRLLSN